MEVDVEPDNPGGADLDEPEELVVEEDYVDRPPAGVLEKWWEDMVFGNDIPDEAPPAPAPHLQVLPRAPPLPPPDPEQPEVDPELAQFAMAVDSFMSATVAAAVERSSNSAEFVVGLIEAVSAGLGAAGSAAGSGTPITTCED